MRQMILVALVAWSVDGAVAVAQEGNSNSTAPATGAPTWLTQTSQGFHDLVKASNETIDQMELTGKMYRSGRALLNKANRIVPVLDVVGDLAEVAGATAGDRTDWIGIGETGGGKLGGDGSAALGFAGGGALGFFVGGPLGGLVGSFVGSMASREVFDRVGKPYVERAANQIASTQGIKNSLARLRTCEQWINRADQLLKDGHEVEAGRWAWRAKDNLDGLYKILRQANATSKRDRLNRRVLALLARLPSRAEIDRWHKEEQERIKVIHSVKGLLANAHIGYQARQYRDARIYVNRAARFIPILQRHRDTSWLRKIQAYDAALKKIENKKTLSGSAPWEGAGIGGQIVFSINVIGQSFSGQFSGGKKSIAVSGAFSGRFTGTSRQGTLRGGGSIRTAYNGRTLSTGPAPIKAQLSGGVVTGTVTFNGRSHPFSVRVR